MKQVVVRNMQGQKGFCEYQILEDGMLEASFFLPIYGFSIFWPLNEGLIKVVRVVNTKDKRKTIVVFHNST